MTHFRTLTPIKTIDQELLVAAGTLITDEVIQELVARGKERQHRSHALMDYGSIRADFERFITNPPYEVIFADREATESIISHMADVFLPEPVLRSLDYFREHDFHTYRHMLMIFGLSLLLAKDLIPDQEDIRNRAYASPTHDIGKVCVPLDILLKPLPLTREERLILQQHTINGYVLLSYYYGESTSLAVRVARDHHEKRTGSGYPRAISQEDPMVEIVSACDIYDALISPRPYRPVSYDNRSALEVLTEMAEQDEIGWDVLQALIAVNRSDKPHFSQFTVSPVKRGASPPGNVYGMVATKAL